MKKIYLIFNLVLIVLCLSSFTNYSTKIIKLSENNELSSYKIENSYLYKGNFRNLLYDVGVSTNIINNYSVETLNELKSAKNIYISNSSITSPTINRIPLDPHFNFDKYEDGSGGTQNPLEEYESELTDEYMQITYIVSDMGNSEFKFYIDAEWLKMPFFRFWDSLGAACMNMTVINSTRYGYYDYEVNDSGNTIRRYFTSDDMQEAINGNWYGSACKFQIMGLDEYNIFTKFSVHYEYKGHFNGSNDNPYINTTATYCHQRIGINIDQSITISTNDLPCIGFNFTFASNYENRIVSFPYDIKVIV